MVNGNDYGQGNLWRLKNPPTNYRCTHLGPIAQVFLASLLAVWYNYFLLIFFLTFPQWEGRRLYTGPMPLPPINRVNVPGTLLSGHTTLYAFDLSLQACVGLWVRVLIRL